MTNKAYTNTEEYHKKKLPSLREIELELARRKLLAFTTYTFNDAEGNVTNKAYDHNWFHELMCSKLDKFLKDVEEKKSPRLMIFAPPRHGKSEIFSRRFPAFAVGKYPHYNFICSSYNSDLAEEMCKNVQEIMEGKEYQSIFPKVRIKSTMTELDRNRRLPTQNTSKFDIMREDGQRLGVYNATGVASGATGKGAHIFIIDDPVKDAIEATSPNRREVVDMWFKSVAYTRLAPGGGILIIMTRWHDDDLAGRLEKRMNEEEGEKWDIIRCRAIAETKEKNRKEGSALHPERYSVERLLKIKLAVGQRVWDSLYQQHPTMQRGNLFSREFFELVNTPPKKIKSSVRYWDRAATLPNKKNPDPDWTVGVKIDQDFDGVLTVSDVVRERDTPLKIDTLIKKTAEKDGRKTKVAFSEDPGQAGKGQTEGHKKLLRGYILKFRRETGAKEIRAEGCSADAEAGNIRVMKARWNNIFFSELEGFPFMTHDDIIDSLVGAWIVITGGKYDLRRLIESVG